MIQQARFFGPFPISYEDFLDEEQNHILGALPTHVAEEGLRRPFFMAEDDELEQGDSEFICKIMKMDPRDRPTAKQLLNDEWFKLP